MLRFDTNKKMISFIYEIKYTNVCNKQDTVNTALL